MATKEHGEVEAEEEATHEQSFRVVRSWQEAAFEASAREARWKFDLGYAAREIERRLGEIAQDRGAILAWFHDAERAALEESFERLGPLARAASFVDRRAVRQAEASQALTSEQYKEALGQVKRDRAALMAQAPVWVSMGVLSAGDWTSIQSGNGPLDFARDVEDLVEVGLGGWDKIEPMQQVVFSQVSDRITKGQLEAAALNARRLIAHIGRVEGAPDLKKVDWARHAAANRHLLKHHWERVCNAAEYHYKRSGQRELVKQRCVPLGAMRQRG